MTGAHARLTLRRHLNITQQTSLNSCLTIQGLWDIFPEESSCIGLGPKRQKIAMTLIEWTHKEMIIMLRNSRVKIATKTVDQRVQTTHSGHQHELIRAGAIKKTKNRMAFVTKLYANFSAPFVLLP